MKTSDSPWKRPARLRLRGGNPDLLETVRATDLLRTSGAKPKTIKTCEQCGTEMQLLQSRATQRFCSRACYQIWGDDQEWKWMDKTGQKNPRRLAYIFDDPEFKLTKALRKLSDPDLSPDRAARLRGKVATYMEDVIEDANDVLLGLKSWTPTQARVFGQLLNKVLPDLNASHVINETRTRPAEELSIDELERLIASARTEVLPAPGEDDDIPDADYEETDEATDGEPT